MTRTRKRLSVIAGALSFAILVPASAAMADNGDGNIACNIGEFCYTYDGTYTYQKDFWWGGNDDNYYFWNVNTVKQTSYPVRNDAWGAWNRDTQCDFKVVDDRGIYPDDYQTISRSGGWTKLIDSVRNQNDRHERC